MSRTFVLRRSDDVSGVSGTGDVAEGVEFSDGTTVLRWLRAGGSTAVYDSLARMHAIHGHDGRTEVIFTDAASPARATDDALDVERLARAMLTTEPNGYKPEDWWQVSGNALHLYGEWAANAVREYARLSQPDTEETAG